MSDWLAGLKRAVLLRAAILGLTSSLAACASYHPLDLPTASNLSPRLTRLDLRTRFHDARDTGFPLNPHRSITPDQVGLLAIVNNPDLVAERAKLGVADADLLTATLLPNPSVGLGYAFLIAGPANANAITASISQDIRSIVLYSTHVAAAQARFHQVGANLVWQEWQTAEKARLLAVKLYGGRAEIGLRERGLKLVNDALTHVQRATASGALDITAEAPLLAAKAGAERDLATARLAYLTNSQDLDALLGLEPSARFAIAPLRPVHISNNIRPLLQSLPRRRPDLIALQLGYQAANEDVRTAILGQFPAFNLGLSGGSDTSRVVSLGPQVTFDLPIFDHNQAKIASSQATRVQLRAEYQARLDSAEGTARGLIAQSREVSAELAQARTASASAATLLQNAQLAYSQGNLNQRDLVDYETTALERELLVAGYEETLKENALALEIELGVGLPQISIPSLDHVTQP